MEVRDDETGTCRPPDAKKVDLGAALAAFDERWSPRIVGRYNGDKIFLAKAKDEFA